MVPHPITALELSERQRPDQAQSPKGRQEAAPFTTPTAAQPSCSHHELLPQRKRGQTETSSLAPLTASGRAPRQPMCKLRAVWPSSACLGTGRSDGPPELPRGEKQPSSSMDPTGQACPLPQPHSAPYRLCACHMQEGRGREPPAPRGQGMNPTTPAVGAALPWHALRCLERWELASSLP